MSLRNQHYVKFNVADKCFNSLPMINVSTRRMSREFVTKALTIWRCDMQNSSQLSVEIVQNSLKDLGLHNTRNLYITNSDLWWNLDDQPVTCI